MGLYRYRQLLFLLALILPSSAMVGLGWLALTQEQELGEKRAVDAQKQILADIRQDIRARLDRIKLQEIEAFGAAGDGRQYSDETVVLVGRVEGKRLLLPWDLSLHSDRFHKELEEGGFAVQAMTAERTEVLDARYDQAVLLYRDLLSAARNPVQQAHSRLLLARALLRSNREAEAFQLYRALLDFPSTIADDQDIPFAFYAAKALHDAGRDKAAVLARIVMDLDTPQTLSPTRAYWLKPIVESAGPDSSHTKLREALRFLDQAVALQADFDSIQTSSSDWPVYGEDPWMIGLSRGGPDSQLIAIAVHTNNLFRRVEAERSSQSVDAPAFRIGIGGSGEPLGEGLPGLRVHFESAPGREALGGLGLRRVFLLSLVLVLGLTGIAGYLVYRDVRRELKIVELRSQFVSSVSHELKTPLTSIRLYAETLQMRGLSSTATHEEYLDIIVSESERLTRLLNNVLDFSRIERGQKTYDMQTTPLVEVINACVHTMRYVLAEEGFQLSVSVRGDIPPVHADRDALEQAILNLLTNAMKYSGKSREIHLRLSRDGETALIEVADSGMGIPLEEQQRIFEKFYRVPLQENRSIPGTGLGLALVDHIAKAHGGNVSVISQVGEGSTFSIRLPIPAGSCP